MNKSFKPKVRRLVLATLLVAGAGLLVAGLIFDQAVIAISGTAAWVLLGVALLWGVRFRLDQVMQAAHLSRAESAEQVKRLERIRASQLKLHSRVALLGQEANRQRGSLVEQVRVLLESSKQVRVLLESSKQAGEDAQRLTLRAYREGNAEWTRVGATLEQHGERHQQQEEAARGVLDRLDLLAGEVGSATSLIAELAESLGASARHQEDASTAAREGFEQLLALAAEERLQRSQAVKGFEEIVAESLLCLREEGKQGLQRVLDTLEEQVGSYERRVFESDKLLQDAVAGVGQSVESLLSGVQEATRHGELIREEVRSSGEGTERTAVTLAKTEAAVEGLAKTVAALEKSWSQGKATIVRTQEKSKREVSQSLEALSQLRDLVAMKAPYPLLDGWAMDPVSMLSLLQHVLERKPRLILECGSGTSTVWLAAALRQIGGGRLVSLDHLEDYAKLTRAALAAQGLGDVADVRTAPLVPVEVAGEACQWYDPVTVSDLADVDLLVVDGPPEGTGQFARYPALPLMADRLRAGALVVLDDTDRPDEGQIVERWRERFAQLAPRSAAGPRTTVMEWCPGR